MVYYSVIMPSIKEAYRRRIAQIEAQHEAARQSIRVHDSGLSSILKQGYNKAQEWFEISNAVEDQQVAYDKSETNPLNIHADVLPFRGGQGAAVPLSKYTGVLHNEERGEPVNEADSHAQEHDKEYGAAKSHQDIQKSDRKLLSRAGDHLAQAISGKESLGNSILSGIQGIGIGAKHLAEKAVGPIYPRDLHNSTLETGKYDEVTSAKPMDTNEAEPSRRRQNTRRLSLPDPKKPRQSNVVSSSNTVAEGTSDSANTNEVVAAEMPLTGTAQGQADIGSSSGGAPYQIERPLSIFGRRSNVYRKAHKFMTFGLGPNIIGETIGTAPNITINAYLTSYLAEIPWHIPALYMNPSEFLLLNPGASVESVSIQVYYRGSTIQFSTAQTGTNLATLNQINDIAVANALNKSGQGSNVSYTAFLPTDEMLPTAITRPKYDAVGTNYRGMIADYYGQDNNGTNFGDYIPHHQIGRQAFLYNYWAQSAIAVGTGANPNTVQFGGWPELSDKIQQMDGKTVINTCVLESHYKPKMGMLTPALANIGHGIPGATTQTANPIIDVGGHLPAVRRATIAGGIPTVSGTSTSTSETSPLTSNDAATVPTYTLYSPIEKSQFSRTGFWGETDPHIQPSIHIGVQPVPALSTAATLTNNLGDRNWTNVRAYWEVVATMITKEYNPTAYPFAQASNVPYGDVVMYAPTAFRASVNLNPRDDGATIAGLYSNIPAPLGIDI